MPERPTGETGIMYYPNIPSVIYDDGSRERLEAIVKFFETRCPNCIEHYCESCMERFKDLILEAAEFLAATEN